MNPETIPLAEKLATLLSDYVTAKFLAHGYHWNVQGKDFKEFHAFFEDLYTDFDSAIDPVAENLRKLGFEAPYQLADFQANATIQEDLIVGGDIETMVASLIRINQALLDDSFASFAAASDVNQQGIANFLAERIDKHQFWNWQLTATLKVSTDIAATAPDMAPDMSDYMPDDSSEEL